VSGERAIGGLNAAAGVSGSDHLCADAGSWIHPPHLIVTDRARDRPHQSGQGNRLRPIREEISMAWTENTNCRGRVRVVGAPGTLLATGINDAGTIVVLYANPDAAPDGQQSPMRMPGIMSGPDD
jgi:hypothetical protein